VNRDPRKDPAKAPATMGRVSEGIPPETRALVIAAVAAIGNMTARLDPTATKEGYPKSRVNTG
jgi:hypothetical protein